MLGRWMMALPWIAAAGCGPRNDADDVGDASSTSTTNAGGHSSTSLFTASTAGADAGTSANSVGDPTSDSGTGSTDGSDSASTGAFPGIESDGGSSNRCGDGIIGPYKECDGKNLQGADCVDLGFRGGVLACNPASCRFDTSMCIGDGPFGGSTGDSTWGTSAGTSGSSSEG
jgi:hypothetical protein